MRTYETTATVTEDGKLTVQVPPDIPSGKHRVVLVIEEQPVPEARREPLKLTAYPWGLTSDTTTFRREDLYGDDGR